MGQLVALSPCFIRRCPALILSSSLGCPMRNLIVEEVLELPGMSKSLLPFHENGRCPCPWPGFGTG